MKFSQLAVLTTAFVGASAYQVRTRDECKDFSITCEYNTGSIGADQYTKAADKIPTEGSVGGNAEHWYAEGRSGDHVTVASSNGGENPTYEEIKRGLDCAATFCDNGDGSSE